MQQYKKFTFNKSVFVSRGGSCQDAKFRPNLVNTLLLHLKINKNEAYSHGHHSTG